MYELIKPGNATRQEMDSTTCELSETKKQAYKKALIQDDDELL
jgi:hypothetical protein